MVGPGTEVTKVGEIVSTNFFLPVIYYLPPRHIFFALQRVFRILAKIFIHNINHE